MEFSNNLIQTENELVLISILRDKVFQLYKKHIKNSSLLNNTREKLRTKDFISSSAENVQKKDILLGVIGTITEFTKWLTRYAIELPDFDKIEQDDFMKMVSSAIWSSIGLQLNEFFHDNDLHYITTNGYQMSRNRMYSVFGTFNTCLFLLMHAKVKQFKFSENELSLYYPFIICSCNGTYYYLI